jgi:hypothetical protein
VLGIYSSGLTLLSLGVRIPRPSAALVDGIILTLGTFYVVFVAENFLGPFQSFLITLGVPLAAWAGIMIADIALRKRDYDERGPLRRARPLRRLGLDVDRDDGRRVGDRLGPGRQQLRRRAAWNNWQGYLLEPLGSARDRSDRRLLGGHLAVRQPRRPARPGPRVRGDVRGPPRRGGPSRVLTGRERTRKSRRPGANARVNHADRAQVRA